MKTRNFLLPAIFILLSFSYSHSQTSYNFTDGLKAAESNGKKIFLDIYSGADSWSKKMDSEVYTSGQVQGSLSNFVFVKLNAEGTDKFNYEKKNYSSSELAKLFGGTGYPTFVFMNSDGSIIKFKYNGEETSSISGFLGENDFIEMLNFFALNKYKNTDLSTIFEN